jgi:adenylate cyclase class 2
VGSPGRTPHGGGTAAARPRGGGAHRRHGEGAPAAGSGDESRFKVRQEAEFEIPDGERFRAVLEVAGFRPLWRYQKWRREYRLPGAVVVVDEIPHGTWVEIEGDAEAIDRIASALGVTEAERVRESYREIHVRACVEAGHPVGDMVFAGAAAPEGE